MLAFIRRSSQGYSYVGAAVLRGRMTAEQMRAAADLAEQFASG